MRLHRSLLLAAACAAACGGAGTARPGGPAPALADPLLRRVPAETPYLFAILEPPPPSYYAKQAGPLRQLDGLLARVKQLIDEHEVAVAELPVEVRLMIEGMAELGGTVDAASLGRLGLGPRMRGVIYAVDLLPVALIELEDGARLRAAIERVAGRAGYALPVATSGGREHWRFPIGEYAVIAHLEGNHLTVALIDGGSAGDLAELLDGPPAGRSLADSGEVERVIARHGVTRESVGWVDLGRVAAGLGTGGPVARALLGAGDLDCAADVVALLAGLPRLYFGATGITEQAASGILVVETGPDPRRTLAGVRAPIPGWPPGAAGRLELGLGVDVGELLRWAAATASELADRRFRCPGVGEAVARLVPVATAMRALAGTPVGDLRGLTIAVHDLAIDEGRVELTVVAGTASPDALLDLVAQAVPGLISERPVVGGPALAVSLPGGVDAAIGGVHLAVAAGGVGLAVGPGAAAELVRRLALPPTSSPGQVARLRMDAAFWAHLSDRMEAERGDDLDRELGRAMDPRPDDYAHLGQLEVSLEVTEIGVAVRGTQHYR